MSEIMLKRRHSLTLEGARSAVEKIAAQLKRDFGFEYGWQRGVLHFQRQGVQGLLQVTDKDVQLEARLGLLLSVMKPRIEQEIDAQFDRYFGSPAAKAPAAPKRVARGPAPGRGARAAASPRGTRPRSAR